MINGVTELAMMKADVLSGMSDLRVCTAYRVNGQVTDRMPYDISSTIEPVLEPVEGWGELRADRPIPTGLQHYIGLIEQHVGVPVKLVSLGPDRDQTLLRDKTLVN